LDELLRSIIYSNLTDFSLEQFIKEQEEQERRFLNTSKLKAIEKIMRRCAYMREDQILMVFQFCKIVCCRKDIFDRVQEEEKSDVFSLSYENDFQINNEIFGKDINLSLNSNKNLGNKDDCAWGIEEKGKHLL